MFACCSFNGENSKSLTKGWNFSKKEEQEQLQKCDMYIFMCMHIDQRNVHRVRFCYPLIAFSSGDSRCGGGDDVIVIAFQLNSIIKEKGPVCKYIRKSKSSSADDPY